MATMNGTQGSQDNAKPIKESKQDHQGYWLRIIVKFNDDVELPYEDGAERYLDDSQAAQWKRLEAEFPGITLNRLYTVLEAGQIREMVKLAVSLDPDYSPPNFLTYFVVDSPPGVTPQEMAAAFAEWQIVQTANFDPPGSEPIVSPGDDPRAVNQGYLDPAPHGIDAEFAWPRAGGLGFTGGDGAGIRVIDLERGWTLNHEDLVGQGATLLHGAIRDGSKAHGTSVLGELCAVDNTIGCIGIAPNVASVHVVSYWTSTRANAILAAIDHLEFGDVLLLEAQLDPNGGTDWYPIEVLDAEFDIIRLATALGLVVVEAAANGSNDLDTYTVGGKGRSWSARQSLQCRIRVLHPPITAAGWIAMPGVRTSIPRLPTTWAPPIHIRRVLD
jgi:hypothetical protein